MQIKSILLAISLPITLTLASCSNSATSEDVTARQDIMKNWKDAKDVMEEMIKAPDTFDAEKFKENAQFIDEDSSSPWSHFDDKANVGEATEAVWSNPDQFKAKIDAFEQAAADLNTAAQNATSAEQVAPAFQALGKTCGSCHDDFKAPHD